ncbi:L,D-transpeptidase [Rubrivirga sp. S365]|uniref:L,D-transpeptidase n=1 Tax=Rubrivirga litoralis TaxID=3075598 RepID=A0ABU3BSK9_9BACT|nr:MULTISPECIES: L,D-transpeptidase [unclassified Rubrivirga]MDT0632281.1 L,D-transpeptidase [Rubrivirga sp. F394]MDT7856334.1 L,D-transpeptidase [Rubrivirga sp. S365]
MRLSRYALALPALLGAALLVTPAAAQSAADRAADGAISQDFQEDEPVTYFSQSWLIDTMNRRTSESIRDVPRVHYGYYVVPEDQNRLEARLALYNKFGGDRDVIKPLLWLLNRNDLENLSPGDTLVVPSEFGLDFRAYSPFPRYYAGAADLDKVVILDKQIQAWGAYHRGELARWGIINTGVESARTPSGRFNVNWKQDYRVSTLSPGFGSSAPDAELWEMYWVMNLHEARGIHMHQYALPTSGPASHGCIRMLEPDAKWLYGWTDTWEVENQRDPISSVGADIVDQGTMVLIIGDDISEPPRPFLHRDAYPVIRMVDLPPDPYAVPAGSPQQKAFDRLGGRV